MNATRTYPHLGSIVNWSGVVYSGIIAGAVFFFAQFFLLWAFGYANPWEFPQRIAAIVLGPDVLSQPATSELPMMRVAVVVLLFFSLVYAAILAVLIETRSSKLAILIGLGFGLILYLFNFHVATLVWPWLAEARDLATILSHMVFGATAAWAYKRFTL